MQLAASLFEDILVYRKAEYKLEQEQQISAPAEAIAEGGEKEDERSRLGFNDIIPTLSRHPREQGGPWQEQCNW